MFKRISATLLILVAAMLPLAVSLNQSAFASASSDAACQGVGEVSNSSGCGDGGGTDVNGVITDVVNILSIIVGVAAVIMIIVAGFKFIFSGGESSNVSGAKNTIIYAIVGLVVVALAQVIVHFVLNRIGS